jgi:hypothetical protein
LRFPCQAEKVIRDEKLSFNRRFQGTSEDAPEEF